MSAADPAEARGAAPGRRTSGLGAITVATVVAGGIGFLILALVPKVIAPADYLEFSKFWAGLYLLVAALSGLQQEVARAARPVDAAGWPAADLEVVPADAAGLEVVHTGHAGEDAAGLNASEAAPGRAPKPAPQRTHLGGFALASGLVAGGLVGVSAPLWGPLVFPDHPIALPAAIAVALVAYAGVAVLSGVFYGLKLWPAVAGLTIADAAVRLALVGGALLAGGSIPVLGWAVALPFGLALALLWVLNRGRVVGRYTLDVGPRQLVRNASKAIGGAVALGVLISGFPLLIGIAAASADKTQVGALVNVVTMTRAPLVIPILALQGWLTIYFRQRSAEQPRPLVLVVGGVLGVASLGAAVAFVIEPWLLQAIWGAKYLVDAPTCAGIVFTAGLTAALCVSGPATLAAGRHTAYLAGWVLAASTTVAVLFALPLELAPRVLLAMALGPVVGLVVHFLGLRSTAGASS